MPGGREWWSPGLLFFVRGRGGIAGSVLSRKGSCIPGRLIAGLRAPPPANAYGRVISRRASVS